MNTLTLATLKSFAEIVVQRGEANPKAVASKVEAGRRLLRLVAGEPFADRGVTDPLGGVDNALFHMLDAVSAGFPTATPDELQAVFAPSLAAMQARDGDAITIGHVCSLFSVLVKENATTQQNRCNDVVRSCRTLSTVLLNIAEGVETVGGPIELADLGLNLADHRELAAMLSTMISVDVRVLADAKTGTCCLAIYP